LDREYTLATRDYIYGGFDGYDELPNCTNIDKTTDIDNMFSICLKFFDVLVQDLSNLKPGSFGFDVTNTKMKSFICENTVLENGITKVAIKSQSRINILHK
jgi:hypothetical protein